MSKQNRNVELVRSATSALARLDLPSFRALCHPDVELDWSRRLLDSEVIRGYDGLERFFEETQGIFDEIVFEEDEIASYGNEVLVVSRAHFRGRASGVEVQARGANIWTIRDGKLARFRFYQTKDDALKDLEARHTQPGAGSPGGS